MIYTLFYTAVTALFLMLFKRSLRDGDLSGRWLYIWGIILLIFIFPLINPDYKLTEKIYELKSSDNFGMMLSERTVLSRQGIIGIAWISDSVLLVLYYFGKLIKSISGGLRTKAVNEPQLKTAKAALGIAAAVLAVCASECFISSEVLFQAEGFSFTAPAVNVSEYASVNYEYVSEARSLGVVAEHYIPEPIYQIDDVRPDPPLIEIYGYNHTIYRNDSFFEYSDSRPGKRQTVYYIEYPDKPSHYAVLFFKADEFTGKETEAILGSFKFEASDLYCKAESYLEEEFEKAYSSGCEILNLSIADWRESPTEAEFTYKFTFVKNTDDGTDDYAEKARALSGSGYSEKQKKEYLEAETETIRLKLVFGGGEPEMFCESDEPGEYWRPANAEALVSF